MQLEAWQADCETVFAAVRRQLEIRDELCEQLTSGNLSLETLLRDADLLRAHADTKLLSLLDCSPSIGKVPARKILADRQSHRLGQFSSSELADILAQIAAHTAAQP